MSHLRRALLLAAVAIGGISLLAPLAARSAALVPADAADHLIATSDTPLRAERLRAARGYAAWPACRAELGLP